MAEVPITINRNDYIVACADGEEDHLREIAARVNSEVEGLVKTVGQVGEARLLIMVSLLLADQLEDLGEGLSTDVKPAASLKKETNSGDEAEAIGAMHAAAQRIENLAASIKSA